MTRANPTPRHLEVIDLSAVSVRDSIEITAEERQLFNSLVLLRFHTGRRELGLKKPAPK
ncbi:MAG: hypothetical protein M3R21_00060 [Candidatus Dormibacteraeota bacterium]|nr:hypothetical protein [Candidatus Dormibacteraeota bacterium]